MTLPIVFVPGLMCTGRIYEAQVLALGQSHPVLLTNHWSHDAMDAIAASILAIAPETFAIVGTSMGGYVALEIMRQAPGRVEKLALLSTSARPDTPERSADRRQQVQAARKFGVKGGTKALYPKLVHPARHEDAALLQVFIDMADEIGVEGFARQIEAIIGRADSRPLLAGINIPTLVAAGADDALIPPENSHEMAAGIPGAKLEIVPNCGHMGMMELPETYVRLLADWIG